MLDTVSQKDDQHISKETHQGRREADKNLTAYVN